MRYHAHESYEKFENNGFSSANDVFERKQLALTLESIISSSEDGLVIGLDAPWGEGKTSFVKMLKHQLKGSTPFLYFDAFQSDYHHDPITALAGEIYTQAAELSLLGDDAAKNFSSAVEQLVKSSFNVGFKFLIRAVAYKLLGTSDDRDLEKIFSGVGDDLAKEVERGHCEPEVKQSQLDLYKLEKSNISSLKNALECLVKDMLDIFNREKGANSKASNVVFVIDELDRCRPSYAIELLESIKHMFSAPNIVFMLVINRKQLQHSITGLYGPEFDAAMYLEKFIHLNISLPTGGEIDSDQSLGPLTRYVQERSDLLEIRMAEPEYFAGCLKALKIPPRQANKAIIAFGILQNSSKGELFMHEEIVQISVNLCVISSLRRDIFLQFANSKYLSISNDSFWDIRRPLGNEFANHARALYKIYSGGYSERKEMGVFLEGIQKQHPDCSWTSGIDIVVDICETLRHINVVDTFD